MTSTNPWLSPCVTRSPRSTSCSSEVLTEYTYHKSVLSNSASSDTKPHSHLCSRTLSVLSSSSLSVVDPSSSSSVSVTSVNELSVSSSSRVGVSAAYCKSYQYSCPSIIGCKEKIPLLRGALCRLPLGPGDLERGLSSSLSVSAGSSTKQWLDNHKTCGLTNGVRLSLLGFASFVRLVRGALTGRLCSSLAESLCTTKR